MGLLEIEFESKKMGYINPKMLDIMGYPYEEMLKEKGFQRYIHPEDFDKIDFSEILEGLD